MSVNLQKKTNDTFLMNKIHEFEKHMDDLQRQKKKLSAKRQRQQKKLKKKKKKRERAERERDAQIQKNKYLAATRNTTKRSARLDACYFDFFK